MIYDSISRSISQRSRISELSDRDKVNLFNDLMDDLGILRRCQEEPDRTAGFQEIWQEQVNIAWNK